MSIFFIPVSYVICKLRCVIAAIVYPYAIVPVTVTACA